MPHALVVTAHHDDALLWCGGAIQRTLAQGWTWTVVAMCVANRAQQAFFDAYCDDLGVSGVRFAFKNYQVDALFAHNSRQAMVDALAEVMHRAPVDWVFAHSRGKRGEYGRHANHHETLVATYALVPVEQVVCFSYGQHYRANGIGAVARHESDYFLPLTYPEIIHKAQWCTRAPDLNTSLKQLGYVCPNPEGFDTGLALPEPFLRRVP